MSSEQLKFFDFREKGQKKLFVSISVDIIGFCVILVVLLIVFSYILGVERGKGHFAKGEKVSRELVSKEAMESIYQTQTTVVSQGISPSSTDNTTSSDTKSYAIQVASYRFSSAAEREKKKLEEKGYHAKIVKKGEYLIVLVGEYLSREKALQNLNNLKSSYKDCFLRRL